MNLVFFILLLFAFNSCTKPGEEIPDDNKIKVDSGKKCGCDPIINN